MSELERLRAELNRWQELYGADSPQDGVATMAVGKIVREQERKLKRLRAALEQLTVAVENMRVPQTVADAGLQIFVTLGPAVEAARAALAAGEARK